ncbi:hypothetical protein, partial [Paenibacillus agricola]|uniref:hypothetical protein n=1 Tax=Paenibacillus agricola TaxID=2716264 RepID=UPI001A9CE885
MDIMNSFSIILYSPFVRMYPFSNKIFIPRYSNIHFLHKKVNALFPFLKLISNSSFPYHFSLVIKLVCPSLGFKGLSRIYSLIRRISSPWKTVAAWKVRSLDIIRHRYS